MLHFILWQKCLTGWTPSSLMNACPGLSFCYHGNLRFWERTERCVAPSSHKNAHLHVQQGQTWVGGGGGSAWLSDQCLDTNESTWMFYAPPFFPQHFNRTADDKQLLLALIGKSALVRVVFRTRLWCHLETLWHLKTLRAFLLICTTWHVPLPSRHEYAEVMGTLQCNKNKTNKFLNLLTRITTCLQEEPAAVKRGKPLTECLDCGNIMSVPCLLPSEPTRSSVEPCVCMFSFPLLLCPKLALP